MATAIAAMVATTAVTATTATTTAVAATTTAILRIRAGSTTEGVRHQHYRC